MTESTILEYWDSYVQAVKIYWHEPTPENKRAAEAWHTAFKQSFLSDEPQEMVVH